MFTKPVRIDDVVEILQKLKQLHGNVEVMLDWYPDRWGARHPEDIMYYGGKLNAVVFEGHLDLTPKEKNISYVPEEYVQGLGRMQRLPEDKQ